MADLDSTIARLMDQQGWDKDSVLDLLVNFLDLDGALRERAIDFLVVAAQEENTASEDEQALALDDA